MRRSLQIAILLCGALHQQRLISTVQQVLRLDVHRCWIPVLLVKLSWLDFIHAIITKSCFLHGILEFEFSLISVNILFKPLNYHFEVGNMISLLHDMRDQLGVLLEHILLQATTVDVLDELCHCLVCSDGWI